jgi:hypothetical protein
MPTTNESAKMLNTSVCFCATKDQKVRYLQEAIKISSKSSGDVTDFSVKKLVMCFYQGRIVKVFLWWLFESFCFS